LAKVRFRFSERFKVLATDDDDWFDVMLPSDTRLFVDPFRVYADDTGIWKGAKPNVPYLLPTTPYCNTEVGPESASSPKSG
jgi:hypothetical protein